MASNIFKNAWQDTKALIPKEAMLLMGGVLVFLIPIITLFSGFSELASQYRDYRDIPFLMFCYVIASFHNLVLVGSFYLAFLPAMYAYALTGRSYMKRKFKTNYDGMSELYFRTSKKSQYEVARQILKQKGADGGIFVFYDTHGCFRFSFVRIFHTGARRQFSTYKRYSFFVDPSLTNKTFRQQIKKARFSSLDEIQETFSLEAVTDAFYSDFKPKFDKLPESVQGLEEKKDKEDFALLFVIRIIFLGFVQKKGWLDKKGFLQNYWGEYKQGKNKEDTFYSNWLEPLFFEALNSPPGRKVKYNNNPFSETTETTLQMAPYLNGELFKEHQGIDKRGFVYMPDTQIAEFIEFLFQYNFTIEENTNIDEELELSPEFLGIIFERLVNKSDGAVYTPPPVRESNPCCRRERKKSYAFMNAYEH